MGAAGIEDKSISYQPASLVRDQTHTRSKSIERGDKKDSPPARPSSSALGINQYQKSAEKNQKWCKIVN